MALDAVLGPLEITRGLDRALQDFECDTMRFSFLFELPADTEVTRSHQHIF